MIQNAYFYYANVCGSAKNYCNLLVMLMVIEFDDDDDCGIDVRAIVLAE